MTQLTRSPKAKTRIGKARKKARVVSFHCVLRDRFGHVLSSSFNNEIVVSSERQKNALDGLIRGLGNVQKGERRQLNVCADEAYGFYDSELVLEVPRRKFPEGSLQIGSNVLAESGDGGKRLYRVVALSRTHVTLDGNHPLAGQDLVFDIETIDVRDATPAEVAEADGGEAKGNGGDRGELNRAPSMATPSDSARQGDLGARRPFGYLH